MTYPIGFECLTETPPHDGEWNELLQIDANVQAVDDNSVTLVTAIDTTIILPRSVFERRDCSPVPGMALSFDLQCGIRGRYMSRLMVGHRFRASERQGED